jgi:hypothetical protein
VLAYNLMMLAIVAVCLAAIHIRFDERQRRQVNVHGSPYSLSIRSMAFANLRSFGLSKPKSARRWHTRLDALMKTPTGRRSLCAELHPGIGTVRRRPYRKIFCALNTRPPNAPARSPGSRYLCSNRLSERLGDGLKLGNGLPFSISREYNQ